MSNSKLSNIYYNPQGYWKGLTAVKKLVSAANVPGDVAKDWLKKQAIWQIYLPAPRHILRPKFDVRVPNEVHQADLLFLPHDRVGRRTYKYALTVVDVASRYKEAEPLTSKGAAEVADALSRIYTRGPLKWSKLLQVDPGRGFMGSVSQLLATHSVEVRRGRVDVHRDQGIMERWNRTLAERLFGHQYAQEIRLPAGLRVFDGQVLARVHGHGVAQGPVLPPFVIEDLPGGLYAHLHDVIQDQLLLGRVWARDRHKDVLATSVPGR